MNDTLIQRLSTLVLLVCLTAIAGTVALVVSPALRQRVGVGPAAAQPPYAVGDHVDIEAAAYRPSPVSLVLFARSTCPACQRSHDFHKQVVASGKSRGVPTVLVTPSTDADAEQAYAGRLGIGVAQTFQALPGSIKLQSIPALMVVDASGLIRHVWYGAPDAATQSTILASVATLGGVYVP